MDNVMKSFIDECISKLREILEVFTVSLDEENTRRNPENDEDATDNDETYA